MICTKHELFELVHVVSISLLTGKRGCIFSVYVSMDFYSLYLLVHGAAFFLFTCACSNFVLCLLVRVNVLSLLTGAFDCIRVSSCFKC